MRFLLNNRCRNIQISGLTHDKEMQLRLSKNCKFETIWRLNYIFYKSISCKLCVVLQQCKFSLYIIFYNYLVVTKLIVETYFTVTLLCTGLDARLLEWFTTTRIETNADVIDILDWKSLKALPKRVSAGVYDVRKLYKELCTVRFCTLPNKKLILQYRAMDYI